MNWTPHLASWTGQKLTSAASGLNIVSLDTSEGNTSISHKQNKYNFVSFRISDTD